MSTAFFTQLKSSLPALAWPWVTAALRQDPIVWRSLTSSDYLLTRIQGQTLNLPSDWSPASLAMIALSLPIPLEELRISPLTPLETDLRKKVLHTLEGLAPDISAPTLEQAGMLALALREHYRLRKSWDDILNTLQARPLTFWRTSLACLYGIIPDPCELLLALVHPGASSEQIELALHILLSNPIHPDEQVEIIHTLSHKRNQSSPLTAPERLIMLRVIAVQRPQLATRLGRLWLESIPGKTPTNEWLISDPVVQLRELEELILLYEIQCTAGCPSQALPILTRVQEGVHHLQANLTSVQAYIASTSNEEITGPNGAWRQAIAALSPLSEENIPSYATMLITNLLDAGQYEEVKRLIPNKPDLGQLHPALSFTLARLSFQNGDIDQAKLAAVSALRAISVRPSSFMDTSRAMFTQLAQLLLDLDLIPDAALAAQLALKAHPDDLEMLTLLGATSHTTHNLKEAIYAYQSAVLLKPNDTSLRRRLAVSLEANNEWDEALNERQAIIEAELDPATILDDLHALAKCALQANSPDQALEASQQALQLSSNDGLAYTHMGQALFLLGKTQEALDHITRATHIAPHLPEPWLALADAQNKLSSPQSALEALQTGAQAIPDSPIIHLALGEYHIKKNALSQALTALKRASELSPSDLTISLRLGQVLHKLGHSEESKQVLEAVHQISPGHVDIAYTYAKVLLDLGRCNEALQPLEVVIDSNPCNDPEPYLEYADTLLSTIDQSSPRIDSCNTPSIYKAIEAVQHAREIDPGSCKALALVAETLAVSGDLSAALEAFQSAMESDIVENKEWLTRLSYGMGRVALTLGQPEIAIASLQEAAQAEQGNHLVQRALSEAYLAANLPQDALLSARTAVNLAIDDVDTLVWFAEHAIRIGEISQKESSPVHTPILTKQTSDEALNALKLAIQLAPHSIDLYVLLGKLQAQSGDKPTAIETLRQVGSSKNASIANLENAATQLIKLGDAYSATHCLERAILIGKESSDQMPQSLYKTLATAYQEVGDFQSTLTTLDQALIHFPNEASLYIFKANLLLELGKSEEALTCLEGAIQEITPDHHTDELYFLTALILRSKGDLPAALTRAKLGVSLYFQDPIVDNQRTHKNTIALHFLIADLYRALLHPHHARQILKDNYRPSSTATHDQLDHMCLQYELTMESNEGLELSPEVVTALEDDPTNPRLMAIYARLLARRGDYSAALETLNSASQVFLAHSTHSRESHLSSQYKSSANNLALAEAALELWQWDEAILLSQKISEMLPAEPMAQLSLAKAIVQRAEFQRLCEAMDVITHAPGSTAISEQAQSEFEAAIEAVKRTLQNIQLDTDENDASALIQENPILVHWQARGQAVFGSDLMSNEAIGILKESCTSSALQNTYLVPDGIAALTAALNRLSTDEDTKTHLTSIFEVVHTFPQHPLILIQLALSLIEKQPHEALQAAQTACNSINGFQYPQTGIANALLARIANHTGDYVTAHQAIENALDVWPDEPRWRALAADISIENKDTLSAIAHLEEAVRKEPQNINHYLALGRAYLTSSDHNAIYIKRSIRTLERASQLAPENSEVWFTLAHAHMLRGDLSEAANCVEKTISLAPDKVEVLLLSAEIALKSDLPDMAYQRAKSILHNQPNNAAATLILAKALQALNQPSEALKILVESLPFTENPIPLQLEQANLLYQLQGPEAALDVLKSLANQNPDEPSVCIPLARALADIGQSEAAIQIAQSALKTGKGNLNSIELAELHHILGYLLRITGQLDQAIFHLTNAIRHAPNSLEIFLELGHTHQERRQHRQALQIYQQATQIAPDDPRPFFKAGLALKESKDYRESESALRRAAQLAPDDLNIRRQLAAVVALNLVHNPRRSRVEFE